MIKYDVIIIGAGPAGLFAAINIKKDKKVLLLEKNDIAGRKLLMAGAGRCNITHSGDIKDFFNHYGENSKFLKNAFKEFSNEKTVEYLKQNKLNIISDKNGKIFPETEKSKDVLNILIEDCQKNDVHFKNKKTVLYIGKDEESFIIKTKEDTYSSDVLIISTGGKSYPTSGSSGDGYNFAKKLGHIIIEPKPSLAPIFVKNYDMQNLAGISLKKTEIQLYRNNKKIKTHYGDIGFTHKGLSGPGILDFSRYFCNGDMLKINLINENKDEFRLKFIESVEEDGNINIKKFLKSFGLIESLIMYILDKVSINSNEKIGNVNKKHRNNLIENLCEALFEIEKIGDFNVAMATAGGISLKEVSSKTMQSNLLDNLYFIGEILDIDGDTGGYNIQAALSTAYVAAKNINKSE